jgi:hypothetical protein
LLRIGAAHFRTDQGKGNKKDNPQEYPPDHTRGAHRRGGGKCVQQQNGGHGEQHHIALSQSLGVDDFSSHYFFQYK